MLTSLSIRDVVLIDRLDLNFDRGLSVLTGETGAGKSILLDALGLALGWRADLGLIRAMAAIRRDEVGRPVRITGTFEDVSSVSDAPAPEIAADSVAAAA